MFQRTARYRSFVAARYRQRERPAESGAQPSVQGDRQGGPDHLVTVTRVAEVGRASDPDLRRQATPT